MIYDDDAGEHRGVGNSHCPKHQYPRWAKVHVPAAPLPIQLPVEGLGKVQVSEPLYPHGSCWLKTGPVLAVVAIWGVQQQTDLS